MTTTFTNQSKVTLVDYMGGDLSVVDAARVSFDKVSTLDENGDLTAGDAKLIDYLARNNHWTPFAHAMVTLRIATPVFVARQWYRSTVGCARNEVSRRYVDGSPVIYLPDELRSRPEGSVKQGSGGVHPRTDYWRDQMRRLHEWSDAVYANMIDDGVAPEQARMVLPTAHMTEFVETASLAFYARVAGLRLDGHAQAEIQDLMKLVAEVVAPIAPVSWKALTK